MEKLLQCEKVERAPLTEKEWGLIEFIRKMGFGTLTLICKDGEPKHIKEGFKDINL